jgi:hypothetical protein
MLINSGIIVAIVERDGQAELSIHEIVLK